MSRIGRRTVVMAVGAALATALFPRSSLGQAATSFPELLASLDDGASRAAAGEQDFVQLGPTPQQTLANPQLPRRWFSDKEISDDAFLLVLTCEISNKDIYIAKYRTPIWPRGESGVTIGVGYDLGYQKHEYVVEDWGSILQQSEVNPLLTVVGIKGLPAKAARDTVSEVVVEWEEALQNFRATLRYYAGQTVRYFPNSDELSADSFGALVSLVYNRGSSTQRNPNDPLDRRREMREIKALCLSRNFKDIPAQIRSMVRLWKDKPDMKGLLTRREAEAALFERGLAR